MDYLKNYKEISDERLLFLAKYEFDDLVPEAQRDLNIELKNRNLDITVKEYKEIENEEISEEEFLQIAKEYRSYDCPYCGKNIGGNNIIKISYFYFLIIAATWGSLEYVGCSNCLISQLQKRKKNLLWLALLFPIQTVISIIDYFECNKIIKKIQNENYATDEYYQYVKKNIFDIKQTLKKKNNI